MKNVIQTKTGLNVLGGLILAQPQPTDVSRIVSVDSPAIFVYVFGHLFVQNGTIFQQEANRTVGTPTGFGKGAWVLRGSRVLRTLE